jgi:hypothetical protein
MTDMETVEMGSLVIAKAHRVSLGRVRKTF